MKTLCPPLSKVRQELLENTERLGRLAGSLDDTGWGRRAANGGWSPAECAMHLNTTSNALVPILNAALDGAKEYCECSSRHPRFDPVGWLLLKSIEPPYRLRMKTPPTFVPSAIAPKHEVLERWEDSQASIIATLERGDAYPLGNIFIRSPFEARMKYSVYSAFRIIAAHQRRHLWQAERNAGVHWVPATVRVEAAQGQS